MYEVNDTIVLVFLSRTIGSEAAGSEDILIKNLMKTIEPIAESHLYLNINTSCCETVHPHVLMGNRTKSKNIHISPFFLICARSIYCTSVHPRREIARLFLFLRIPPFFFFFLLQGVLVSGEFFLSRIEGSFTVQTAKPTEGM